MSIKADGFIGAVMAIEGISDATVLLHGQSGCRKGLILSERFNPRVERIHSVDNPVYSGCTTVPYSAVNAGDYTGKSKEKLEKALRYVSCEDYSLIALMCSPGISIVGDDCISAVRKCGLSDRAIVFDNSEFGTNVWEGFDNAISKVLRECCHAREAVRKNTVVITGLSITHKDWYTVRKETQEMLSLLGLEAVCFAGAGCSLEELRSSVNAEYCISLSPDFSRMTDSFYSKSGLKVISIGYSPVGFDAVEKLWSQVASETGTDYSPVREMIRDYRDHAFRCIVASRRSLRGKTFRIESSESITKPLEKFLSESFAMVRDDSLPEICFCDGNKCSMVQRFSDVRYIDIGFPSNKVDFGKNPVLGLEGTMYLLDCLFN